MRQTVLNLGGFIAGLKRRFDRRDGKRVLIHDILSIQILTTALIGGLAVAGLYWGGQWVLQDNYGRWALQWTEELNELGAPLYLADDTEAVIRLESYIERYAEITRVSYFRPDGSVLFSLDKRQADDVVALPPRMRQTLADMVGKEQPYLIQSGIIDPRQFDVLAPMWTESMSSDGLLTLGAADADVPTERRLVGFVGLHLDFIVFHDRLLANIKAAVLGLLVLLGLSALFGRLALRRALASIADLQAPIKELAKGNLDVKFEPAEHREISEIVEALESTASALSERDARLVELANHDNLTGLFNRRRFVEELKAELADVIEQGHTSALLFVDLDQFKYVNDTCGHPAGDRLLGRVADELVRSTGSDGVVARFGGDEFAVLIRDTDRAGIRKVAKEILADMRQLAHVEDDRVFHVHCSIGITMINGNEADHEELIAQADMACRDAKLGGRNRVQFYRTSERKAERLVSDVGWMSRLREAIDNDAFRLRYQPINHIATGRTTHHEVLLRLQGPDGTLFAPDAFLPAAERFGLMSEIDFWAIAAAASAYAEHSKGNPQLRLSINLSANAFETDELVSFIQQQFAEHEVPPEHVIFEITESLAVRRPRHVEKKISALRGMGCGLALDDFGTGYSSFSYLQSLHFDYIKIDGAFVRGLVDNPVNQKMIRLIAEIGAEAGMQTIAEYVQDAESLLLLGDLGIDMAQGYYVGRPISRPTPKPTPISLRSRRQRQIS